VPQIVGGVIGGLAAILGLSFLILWYYRRRRIQSLRRKTTAALEPLFTQTPPMTQAMTAPVIPRPTRVATILRLSNGKRVVRNIVPGTNLQTEPPQMGQYEIDAGPVNEGDINGIGEALPPQYEQVFRGPQETRRESPCGAGAHDNRGKLR
jgi:hypothetical protein